jgi:hypothetical protein
MIKQYVLRSAIVVFLPLILHAQGENWVYRYNGPGNGADFTKAIIQGVDGDIYVVGRSIGSGTCEDFAVISLTEAGGTNWVYRYNGPDSIFDEPNSIAMGFDGNVYVAGRSEGASTWDDFIVISIDTLGHEQWIYRHNGTGNYADIAYSVVVGTDSNVYAGGGCNGDTSYSDFTIISLNPLGRERWIYAYNGPVNLGDAAASIIFGTDGYIYGTGSSIGSGDNADLVVVSITSAGAERWVYRYDCYCWEYGRSITQGLDSNIYVVGFVRISSYDDALVVISLTAEGSERWVYTYNINNWNDGFSIVYGSDGNVYIAGRSYGTNSYFVVISLSASGSENWVYTHPTVGFEGAYSIVYGSDGNIYVAGGVEGDFSIICLTPQGNERWIYKYNGPGDDADEAKSLIYGADGTIYAAGYSTGINTSYDFTVISLPPDYSVEEENIALKASFGATILSGPLRLPKDKTCRVFDITGREVMVNRISPGIYFIQIDGKISQKVIKVR